MDTSSKITGLRGPRRMTSGQGKQGKNKYGSSLSMVNP